MKRPTKQEIDRLRIAIGMSGVMAISNPSAELILVTQAELKRLGGKYSLKDAAKVEEFVSSHYKQENDKAN